MIKVITKQMYEDAKALVKEYEEEMAVHKAEVERLREFQQRLREQACGEHYFLERGKWQNGMQCQDCGKII